MVVVQEQYDDVEAASRSNTRRREFLRQYSRGVHAIARRTPIQHQRWRSPDHMSVLILDISKHQYTNSLRNVDQNV